MRDEVVRTVDAEKTPQSRTDLSRIPFALVVVASALLAFALSRLWWLFDEAMIPADVVWPLAALVGVLLTWVSRKGARDLALLAATMAGQAAAAYLALGLAPSVIITPLGGAVEAWVLAWAARRLVAAGADRAPPAEIVRFAAVAFLGAPALGGALTAGLATLLHPPPDPLAVALGVRGPPPVWLSALHWWGRHSLGAMILLPSALLLNREAAARVSTRRTRIEALGVAAVVVAAAAVVFVQGDAVWSLLAAPGLVLAVFAFGAPGAAAATFLTAVIAVTLTALGFGPMGATAQRTPIEAAMALQAFLALCWLLALPFGLMLERLAARIADRAPMSEGEVHFLFSPLGAGVGAAASAAPAGWTPGAEIWTPDRKGRVRLSVGDIERLEAEGDYVRIHTRDGSRFVRGALKAFVARLDPDLFIRVHRSAVVNRDCVHAVRRGRHGSIELETISGARIRVGRAFASDVRQRFGLKRN